MSEEQAQWTVSITQNEYDQLKLDLINARAHAEAAEMKITEMHKMIVQQEATLKSAWMLRDAAIEERQEAEAALRAALRLAAYLIKDILRGMPE